jgi:hypothetical protein
MELERGSSKPDVARSSRAGAIAVNYEFQITNYEFQGSF